VILRDVAQILIVRLFFRKDPMPNRSFRENILIRCPWCKTEAEFHPCMIGHHTTCDNPACRQCYVPKGEGKAVKYDLMRGRELPEELAEIAA
jgi:hypothetical protein